MDSAELQSTPVMQPGETNLSSHMDPDIQRQQKDVLLGMYCESCTHVRHYEAKRATVSNIIMLASVGLIGYIHRLDHEDWPLVGAIVLVGLFGAAFTKFYFDCISSCERRADELRNALNALLFQPSVPTRDSPNTLIDILARADGISPHELEQGSKPKMVWLRKFWPLGITVLALIGTLYALSLPPKQTQDTDSGKIMINFNR